MNKFYTHGFVNCNECFKNNNHWPDDGWDLKQNPAYWGHPKPETLVLGYSKGSTQMKGDIQFDDIAFKGMRLRLKKLLVLLDIINEKIEINTLFHADTKEKIGFASFIRCGISFDNKTSGELIVKSFKNDKIKKVMVKCSKIFLLVNIPRSVKHIILLGSSEDYKKLSMKYFEEIYNDFNKIDKDSFTANNILWTYVAHPSPANGWFNQWIEEYKNKHKGI